MELLIVILVTSNIITILLYYRLYLENTVLIEAGLRNECYQARLTREIEDYKESLRKCHSARKAEVYELQNKLDRIEDVFKPETLHDAFGFKPPFGDQEYRIDDVLARHD